MSASGTVPYHWVIAPAVCFMLGWSIAELDDSWIESTQALLAETYLNKFNTMSGANVDEYLYYVISDDHQSLREFSQQHAGVNRVEQTNYPSVYNVYLNAAARHELLNGLRKLSPVSAVFTVPFMCH